MTVATVERASQPSGRVSMIDRRARRHGLLRAGPICPRAVVNGLIARAGILGGGTAFGTGAVAAALAFAREVDPDFRSDSINRGLGVGFVAGLVIGFFFVAFAAKLVT
jgi:hypothetical protein